MIDDMKASLRGYWTDARPPQRLAYVVGALLIVVGLVHAVIWLFVGGTIEGPLSWRKPTTFGVSFGLATITLAWVAQFLALSDRGLRATLVPVVVADSIEVAWVSLQHARGVRSHFNDDTTFDSVLFDIGGIAVAVTITVITIYTVRAFTTPQAAPSMVLALRVGLVIMLVSMAMGLWMIIRGTAMDVASPATNGDSGSIKFAHAVGLHGIQTLIVLAWLLSFSGLAEAARVRVVALGAVGYTVLTGATVTFTVMGLEPLVHGVAGVLTTVVAVGLLALAYGRTLVALRQPSDRVR
jgi:hypothetical protein